MTEVDNTLSPDRAEVTKKRMPYYPDFYRAKNGDQVVLATCLRVKKGGVWYNTGFTVKYTEDEQGRNATGQLAVVDFIQEAYRFLVFADASEGTDHLYLDPLQDDEAARVSIRPTILGDKE